VFIAPVNFGIYNISNLEVFTSSSTISITLGIGLAYQKIETVIVENKGDAKDTI